MLIWNRWGLWRSAALWHLTDSSESNHTLWSVVIQRRMKLEVNSMLSGRGTQNFRTGRGLRVSYSVILVQPIHTGVKKSKALFTTP